MKWQDFIDLITSEEGFDGNGDDFEAVQKWMRAKGHNPEAVKIGEDETLDLRELFDNRPGKPLDVSAAKRKADEDARINAKVDERLAEIRTVYGPLDRPKGEKANPHRHDIKVGADCLTEDPKGGFKHAGEFYADVFAAGRKEDQYTPDRLQVWHKATLATYGADIPGADGGFSVPPDFRASITQRVEGEDSVLSRCDQVPLSGNSISFPDDETTPWQTSGGILANWEGETGAITQSKPALKLKELKLRKVTVLVPVTEELLADSTAMASYVTRKAGEKLDFKIGEAIFRGTGVGQPQGFIGHASTIDVAKETAQAANTITGINLLKMYSRGYGPYRSNSIWWIQQEAEPQLMRASLTGTTDGGTATTSFGGLVYLPPGGLSDRPFGSLFGRPVISSQHCAQLGTSGDIVFASMPQYVCAIKSGGIEAATSMHLWFDQDAVAFKFRMRVDGQPWNSSTISPRAGSNTMSAFVTLATRA